MASGKKRSLAIIGGGPAGLSLAKLLSRESLLDVRVFEREDRVGGKSFSVGSGTGVIELGTCYATRAHKRVLQWMRREGITIKRVADSYVEGMPLNQWVGGVGHEPLGLEALRYLALREQLLGRSMEDQPPKGVLETLSSPTLDWLLQHQFFKLERLMRRIVSGMGYGLLEEVPLLHTLRWVDLDLLLSGALHEVYMPLEGWSEFWERLARKLDVRTGADVVGVDRCGPKTAVKLRTGETSEFDAVVCAMPIGHFRHLVDPSEDELAVASAIRWSSFSTSLAEVEGWDSKKLQFFPGSVMTSTPAGRLLSRRWEGQGFGADMFVLNQLTGDYSGDELKRILEFECELKGGRLVSVLHQRVWEYFPSLEPFAITDGYVARMRRMQGFKSTWYSGASFSHEAVSSIVRFNEGLARRITGAFDL